MNYFNIEKIVEDLENTKKTFSQAKSSLKKLGGEEEAKKYDKINNKIKELKNLIQTL
jgi:uncharacterized protein YpuA (DUF1002 family)